MFCLFYNLQIFNKTQLFASPFAEDNSLQNHRLQSHGRAWFNTDITSTVEKGKDRKEIGKKKPMLKTSVLVLQGNVTMFVIYLLDLLIMDTKFHSTVRLMKK